MGELGQLLRETREEKGFTPEDIEEQTRIRARFVRALEDGSYDELPTRGHVSGFMRNYALFLGLDIGEVRALYDKETTNHGLFDPGIFHPKDIELSPRKPLLKANLVLGLVLAVVVLVIGGWAFWQYGLPNVQPLLRLLTPSASLPPTATGGAPAVGALQTQDATATEASPTRPNLTRSAATRQSATLTAAPPTETPLSPTDTPSAPPADTPTATPAPPTPTATREQPLLLPTPTPTPSPTATTAPTSAQVEGVALEIKVIERAWLQVTVDDVEQPGELLEAGEERAWEGQYAIYLICGNAGGIEVTVNGEELGALGGRAEVVERTWTPEGEATPTPAT